MGKSTNLNLHLYESEQKFNITGEEDSLNNNMIIIDEAIASASSNIQKHNADLTCHEDIREEVTKNSDDIRSIKANTIQQTPLFANSIDDCTDISKLYVLPDNHIYAYVYSVIMPKIEIKGNKHAVWYRGDGVATFYEPDTSLDNYIGVSCKQTNEISVSPGDKLSVTLRCADIDVDEGSWHANGQYYSSYVDEYNNTPLENGTIFITNSPNKEYKVEITIPEGANYVRFFSYSYAPGTKKDAPELDDVPLKVEWVLCQTAIEEYSWRNTGHAFIPTDYEQDILRLNQDTQDLQNQIDNLVKANNNQQISPLKGKKIVYDGDSICSSWGEQNGGSYPQIIADIVGGTFDNRGVGGGRISSTIGLTDINGELIHSVVDNIVNLPTDGDLYCFEGGVNDHWNGVKLGTFSDSNYTGELDKTTYCGALETIFRYAITHFVGKPICFIITHKCPSSAFTSGYGDTEEIKEQTFSDFRDAALGICEKYSIPVYDAWKDSGINSWNDTQKNIYFIEAKDKDTGELLGYGDGTHPNEKGYRRYYVPQLINLFERIMPQDSPKAEV